MTKLLELTDRGLYCPPADAYIDPWRPVERALITHGHGDHARFGSTSYLAATKSKRILELRLGAEASIQTLAYGSALSQNGVRISFHPAGHILGSAQIRLEYQGEIAVVSGDYKVEADTTCDAFEPIRCHTFVTESTFGLPIYRWQPEAALVSEMNEWWADNQAQGVTSVVLAYSLGKAQRVLAGLEESQGPIAVHGSVFRLNEAYRAAGVVLPDCQTLGTENLHEIRGKGIVVAPPSVQNTPWLRKLAPYSTAFASGWMLVRGQRRRNGVDRGFPISDHADWPGLLEAIAATGAQSVWVTHGSTEAFSRYLCSQGYDARPLQTEFSSESDEREES